MTPWQRPEGSIKRHFKTFFNHASIAASPAVSAAVSALASKAAFTAVSTAITATPPGVGGLTIQHSVLYRQQQQHFPEQQLFFGILAIKFIEFFCTKLLENVL